MQLAPEPEPEPCLDGFELADGAEREAQRMGEGELTATEVKRGEREPWHADELAMRRVLLGRLAQREGWSAAEIAALDSTLMLQSIRGYHHEEQRVETTYERYVKILEWRRSIGADTLLSEPPVETVRRHAEWRQQWHMDAYGEDSLGHPIMGHRLGKIDPSTFLNAFDIDLIKLSYARDMEYFGHRKRVLAQQREVAIYKQVAILDMDGLGLGHFDSKFRGPVKDVIVLLQDMYPEGTHRIFIINTPWAFRAIWATVQGYLDPNVRENIKIVNYDKTKQREAFAAEGIELSQIPVWAGGEWPDGDGWLARHARAGTPAIPPPGAQKLRTESPAMPQPPAVAQLPAEAASVKSTEKTTATPAPNGNRLVARQLLQRICEELSIDGQLTARGARAQGLILREALHQLGLSHPDSVSEEVVLELVCEHLDLEVAFETNPDTEDEQEEPTQPELDPVPDLKLYLEAVDAATQPTVLGTREGGGDGDDQAIEDQVQANDCEAPEPPTWMLQVISQQLEIPADSPRGVLGEAVHQLGLREVMGQGADAQHLTAVCDMLEIDIDMSNTPLARSDGVQMPTQPAVPSTRERGGESEGEPLRSMLTAIRQELEIPISDVALATEEGLVAEAVRQLGLDATSAVDIHEKAQMVCEYLDLDSYGSCVLPNESAPGIGVYKPDGKVHPQKTQTPTPTLLPMPNEALTKQHRSRLLNRWSSTQSSGIDVDTVRPERWPPTPPDPEWWLPEWNRRTIGKGAWREATTMAERMFTGCEHLAHHNIVASSLKSASAQVAVATTVASVSPMSEGVPPQKV